MTYSELLSFRLFNHCTIGKIAWHNFCTIIASPLHSGSVVLTIERSRGRVSPSALLSTALDKPLLYVPSFPSSGIRYWPKGSDALRLGR